MNFSILLNNLIKEFKKNNFYKVYLEGKKLVDIKNDETNLLNLMGITCYKLDKLKESENYLKNSININNNDFQTYLNLGMVLNKSGKYSESIKFISLSLKLNPRNTESYNQMGIAYNKMLKNNDALNFFSKAINLNKNYYSSYVNMGLTHALLKNYEIANKYYLKAIDLKPQNLDVYYYLGNSLNEIGQYEKSIEAYTKVIKSNPKHVKAYNHMGIAYSEINKFDDAIRLYKTAIEINPKYKKPYNNLGHALRQTGKVLEAIKSYDQAIKIDPNYAKANFGKGSCLLLLGKYREGWRYYKWRSSGKLLIKEIVESYSLPILRKKNNLKSKKILILSEQGLGDTIMFSRYAKILADRGAIVTFRVQKRLYKIMLGLDDRIKIITEIVNKNIFDFVVSLMDLPSIFDTTSETIPSKCPYIKSDIKNIKLWNDKIDNNKFNIGICWKVGFEVDKGRSFSLINFKNLSKINRVQLISLQKNDDDQIDKFSRKFNILSFKNLDEEAPFLDTAAIMKNLDLIITSDTSIAHLAGALDCKVWLILQKVPYWPWKIKNSRTLWYSKMKIFRQKYLGDWVYPFKQIEKQLDKELINYKTYKKN